MPIYIDEKNKIFKLDTPSSSYIFSVYDGGYLIHNYFGGKISDSDVRYLIKKENYPSFSAAPPEENGISLDTVALEYPCSGSGDMRASAFETKDNFGYSTTSLKYSGYKSYNGKPEIPGLPATYASLNEADTLEIYLSDKATGAEVTLFYTAFKNYDAIARSVRVKNLSNVPFEIDRVHSLCIDLPDAKDYDIFHLYGSWGRERTPQRRKLINGRQIISSKRGSSSHQHSPFAALCTSNADENYGEVYGVSLIYSGNFSIETELDYFGTGRILAGINPETFSWVLNPNEEFYSPEAVCVYSNCGFGGMSRTFNRLYRDNLCRGPYKNKPRPILINNWEATYFDFNEKKLLNIAKCAADLGIEMFVLDDGWFGKRDDDSTSLGDWTPDYKKLPNGITGLSKKINKLGMKFGLWLEPEMISKESKLYEEHPDFAIHAGKREMSVGRHQYVLDLTRADVREYIYSSIKDILCSSNISYIKWDFNRNITEAGSAGLQKQEQGEFFHRYVLGLYSLLDRLNKEFPELLIEGCSGGGGRFDPGFLFYAPQFWTSDDTDAIERMDIQYGTSFVYPMSSISAHVSVCPNHQTGRTVPFKTRCDIALTGSFGYELDVTKLSDEEKEMIKKQNENYHKYAPLLINGDYLRLKSPYEDRESCAFCFISKDKSKALLTYAVMRTRPGASRHIKLSQLIPDKIYTLSCGGELYGDTLMRAGLDMEGMLIGKDAETAVIYLEAK